jgi:hypothetical protein
VSSLSSVPASAVATPVSFTSQPPTHMATKAVSLTPAVSLSTSSLLSLTSQTAQGASAQHVTSNGPVSASSILQSSPVAQGEFGF